MNVTRKAVQIWKRDKYGPIYPATLTAGKGMKAVQWRGPMFAQPQEALDFLAKYGDPGVEYILMPISPVGAP